MPGSLGVKYVLHLKLFEVQQDSFSMMLFLNYLAEQSLTPLFALDTDLLLHSHFITSSTSYLSDTMYVAYQIFLPIKLF